MEGGGRQILNDRGKMVYKDRAKDTAAQHLQFVLLSTQSDWALAFHNLRPVREQRKRRTRCHLRLKIDRFQTSTFKLHHGLKPVTVSLLFGTKRMKIL